MIMHVEGLRFCLCSDLNFLGTLTPFLDAHYFFYTLECEEPKKCTM